MLSRGELRDAVLGRNDRLERRVAIAMLLHSDDPEREAILASVASDVREPPQQRSVAAIALGQIRTAEAERLLMQIVKNAPPSVAADALRSLGRIARPAAIEAIEACAVSAEPVASAARWAAALIAYRFRLPGHDLPLPPARELLKLGGDEAQPIDIGRASAADARAVLAAVKHEAYGIEVVPRPLTQLRCGTDTHVLCVNRELAAPGSAASLLERKALFALALLRSREGSGYSVSYVVLAHPSRTSREVGLLAPRCSGR